MAFRLRGSSNRPGNLTAQRLHGVENEIFRITQEDDCSSSFFQTFVAVSEMLASAVAGDVEWLMFTAFG